ncbi:MAG: DinB family protein [Bryobacteraceae bacterium]|jgi:uncharacterized damage-inducible protein DinB
MTADEARLHISYSGWASRRLFDAALALPEEEQHREVGVSHKSLLGTLEHIFWGDRVWFVRTVALGVKPPDEPLTVAWPKLQKGWEDWAAALTDQDLLRVIDYKSLNGDEHHTPVWQIVMHVVNHATLHRGQVVSLLRQLGIAPPQTDLITYYRVIKAK